MPPGSVVVVVAPPGSGKSTFVRQWSQSRPGAVSWLTIDRFDDSPAAFWRAVVRSVSAAVDGFGTESLDLIDDDEIVGALHTFCIDIADIADGVFMVLDDSHLIRSDQIWEQLEWLVEHLPPSVTVVLVGREAPNMALSRLRLAGRLTEFGREQLQFDEMETAALFEAAGIDRDDPLVAGLEQLNDGWAAGLRMTIMAVQQGARAADVLDAAFSGHEAWADFILEEVLGRLAPEVRDVLDATSVLPVIDAGTCEAITGDPKAIMHLENLADMQMMVTRHFSPQPLYRVHQLVREVLRARLRRRQGEELVYVRRAAEHLIAVGEISSAVDLWLSAREWRTAADVMVANRHAFRSADQPVVARRVLAAIPSSALVDDPIWALDVLWTISLAGTTLEAVEWLERLAALLGPRPSRLAHARLCALRAALEGHRASGTAMRREWRSIPIEDRALMPADLVAIYPMWDSRVMLLEGDPAAALANLDLHQQQVLSSQATFASGGERADAMALLRMPEAAKVANGAYDDWRSAGSPVAPVASALFRARALLALRNGDAEGAERAAEQAMTMAETRPEGSTPSVLALLRLLDVLEGTGRHEEAVRRLDEYAMKARRVGLGGGAPAILEARRAVLEARLRNQVRRESGIVEPLTERELEVLRLMPTHLSNGEIGARLYMSVNTVKTHTRAIFRKLQVSSRSQAVHQARALGIVEAPAVQARLAQSG